MAASRIDVKSIFSQVARLETVQFLTAIYILQRKKLFESLSFYYQQKRGLCPRFLILNMFTSEKVNQLNNSRLLLVNPKLREKVEQILEMAKMGGFTLLITQGLRTFAEQNELFAQGRSRSGAVVTNAKGGNSYHNYGLAVDFCFIIDGQPSWNEKLYSRIGHWAYLVDLDWGGNWKTIKDFPHVQLTNNLSITDCLKLHIVGGVRGVWEKV